MNISVKLACEVIAAEGFLFSVGFVYLKHEWLRYPGNEESVFFTVLLIILQLYVWRQQRTEPLNLAS